MLKPHLELILIEASFWDSERDYPSYETPYKKEIDWRDKGTEYAKRISQRKHSEK